MMTAHEFYLKWIGKFVDVDKFFGGQCWDLYAQWCIDNGIPYFNCTSSGYVKDIWNNRKTSGILNYMEEVSLNKLQDGDVVVWDNSKPCPLSHIAIFRKDNKNGTGIFLGQNQGGNGSVIQANIAYDGILGALRIKKQKPEINYLIDIQAHVKDKGWLSVVHENQTCGTTGERRRIEALKIDPKKEDIEVMAHMQDIGWKNYGKINKDTVVGTTGERRRLEAIRINCKSRKMKYRVHIEDSGWSAWTIADGIATIGTVGMSKAIEAIQIAFV